jgi:hypothetical protein
MSALEYARCRECDRTIIWVETINDRRIPLDPIPKAFEPPYPKEPNVVIDGATGRARILGHAELALAAGDSTLKRYLPHWASCPYSRKVKEFMDRRRAKAAARRERLEAEEHELDELRHPVGPDEARR